MNRISLPALWPAVVNHLALRAFLISDGTEDYSFRRYSLPPRPVFWVQHAKTPITENRTYPARDASRIERHIRLNNIFAEPE